MIGEGPVDSRHFQEGGQLKKTHCMMVLLRLKFYINFPLKLTDLNKKFISKDGAVSSGVQLQQCLRQVRKVIYST